MTTAHINELIARKKKQTMQVESRLMLYDGIFNTKICTVFDHCYICAHVADIDHCMMLNIIWYMYMYYVTCSSNRALLFFVIFHPDRNKKI